jgi:hypothetical protein
MPSAPPAEREWSAASGVLTDWGHNVNALLGLCEQPGAFSDGDIRSMIIQFLAHVPLHVAAAKRLAGIRRIEDIFKAGGLGDDKE